MSSYIALYYATPDVLEAGAKMSPEERQKGMAPWMEWMAKTGDALVEGNVLMGQGVELTSAGNSQKSSQLIGYSILDAADLTAAQALVEGHPHLAWAEGCTVEVYPVMQMPRG